MKYDDARLLCALGLVLLCVAANFQGAHCFGFSGGHGGGGGGHASGGGGGHYGGGSSGGGRSSGGGGARPVVYGAGAGAVAGAGAGAIAGRAWSDPYSAAGEPRGRGVSGVAGAAVFLAAAAIFRRL
nr:glycine-rich protein DOT1-like [Lolium perenne]